MSNESGEENANFLFGQSFVLKQTVLARHQNLEDAKVFLELGKNYNKEEVWILEKKQVCNFDVHTNDLSTLIGLQYNHKTLEDELKVRRKKAEMLFEVGREMMAAGHPQSNQIAGYNSSLQNHLKELNMLVEQFKLQLEKKLTLFTESHRLEEKGHFLSTNCGLERWDAEEQAGATNRRDMKECVYVDGKGHLVPQADGNGVTSIAYNKEHCKSKEMMENGSSRGQPDGEWREEGISIESDESNEVRTYKPTEFQKMSNDHGIRVHATDDFKRLDITVTKGEVCFLLNKTNDHWCFVRNGSGKVGYVPSKLIQEFEANHDIVRNATDVDNFAKETDSEDQHHSSVNKSPNGNFDGEHGENQAFDVHGVESNDDSSIAVFYAHSNSPNAMYFRTCEMQQKFDAFHRRMNEYYQNVVKNKQQIEPKELDLKIGSFCAVCLDGKWERSKIIGADDEFTRRVKLVDTGIVCRVPIQHIYTLENKFQGCDLLKCSLYGIRSREWSNEDRNFIAAKLSEAEDIRITRRGLELSVYGATFVTIHYKTKGRWINLKDDFISSGPSLGPALLPTTRNPIRTKFAWKPHELPEFDSVFTGNVICVSSIGDVFLHTVTKPLAKVTAICNQLNEAYRLTKPTKADLQCRPGDLCIAKCYEDKNWYRAIVKEINEDREEVKVLFVDYGSLGWVDGRDIRLNIMLEEVPVQAIRCVLHNIRPLNIQHPPRGRVKWPVETLNYLEELTVGKSFSVHVLSRGPPVEVSLINDQKCISAMLVKEKMAEYIRMSRN